MQLKVQPQTAHLSELKRAPLTGTPPALTRTCAEWRPHALRRLQLTTLHQPPNFRPACAKVSVPFCAITCWHLRSSAGAYRRRVRQQSHPEGKSRARAGNFPAGARDHRCTRCPCSSRRKHYHLRKLPSDFQPIPDLHLISLESPFRLFRCLLGDFSKISLGSLRLEP